MAEIGVSKAPRSYALRLGGPLARIYTRNSTNVGYFCVAAAALLLPLVNQNDADIDSAANALAFAALALGLNIVVVFAGFLDLGFADFFAIGAYTYGVASSWQLQPAWSGFREPFQWLDVLTPFLSRYPALAHFLHSLLHSARIDAFSGDNPGPAPLRLECHYLAIVTLGSHEIVPIVARNPRAVTNGAMRLNGVAPPQLFSYNFGIDSTPYYYVGVALVALL